MPLPGSPLRFPRSTWSPWTISRLTAGAGFLKRMNPQAGQTDLYLCSTSLTTNSALQRGQYLNESATGRSFPSWATQTCLICIICVLFELGYNGQANSNRYWQAGELADRSQSVESAKGAESPGAGRMSLLVRPRTMLLECNWVGAWRMVSLEWRLAGDTNQGRSVRVDRRRLWERAISSRVSRFFRIYDFFQN